MSDNAPLYERIPTLDDPSVDKVTSRDGATVNGNSNLQSTKDSFLNSAQQALDSVQNNPTTQNFTNTVSNGPVAQSVKSEYANTQNEFRNLANARASRPSQTTSTGQQLTHYHSMFYQLLSWENPRATGIAYLTTLAFIFATRYLPLIRTVFRVLYICFGVTATAEVVGRALFSTGFASQIRPRRYYTLPKEAVDRFLDDVHELLNFFVIEFQRILFAENVLYTVTAFFTTLVAYYLARLVPLWGLSLIGTSVLYLVPLVYVSNREVIDQQIHHLSQIMNEQATRAKEMAGQHTARATETVKHYAGDYSAKAQDYIGHARQRVPAVANEYSNKTQNAAIDAKNRTVSAASDYSTKAQDAAIDAKDRTAATARDYSNKAQDNLAYAKDRTAATANDYSAKTQDNLAYAKDRTASTANDYSAKTQDNLGYTKDRTAAAANDYSGKTQESLTSAKDTVQSYLGAAKDRVVSATGLGQGQSYQGGQGIVGEDSTYKVDDFPSAPKTGPTPIAEQFGAGDEKHRDAFAGREATLA